MAYEWPSPLRRDVGFGFRGRASGDGELCRQVWLEHRIDAGGARATVDPGDVPTPLGYGPPLKPRFAFMLTQWAQEPRNHEAWKEIMAKHQLADDPFDGNVEENFTYGDAAAWALSVMLSTNKARRFGWTGHVDTLESLFLAYGELNRIGMLPPLVVDRANPLI